MRLRTPLAVAVVGALLIGGATTGTTLALWTDQAMVNEGSVQSGNIELTVNGTASATFTPITNLALNTGSTPGAAQSFTATLSNSGSGKNMRMQIVLDDVTTPSSVLNAGLEIAVQGATTAASCPSPATSGYEDLNATNAHALTPVSIPPGAVRVMCVSLRVKGGAGAGLQSTTGELTFALRGNQVRS
jgi:alternate signal-mediated exported protein